MVLAAFARILLHEFGQAAQCYHLTRSVGPSGFGIFVATPVMYCDVSNVHLLPRADKARVGLAGTAMDILFLSALVFFGGGG